MASATQPFPANTPTIFAVNISLHPTLRLLTLSYYKITAMTPKRRNRLAGWILATTALSLLYACDRLDQDVLPAGGSVISDNQEFFALAHSSATIDLRALLKTQQQVQIKIVTLPRKGDLLEMQMGVLQYLPNDNFTQGEDSFRYDVLDLNNMVLARDSVVIIVSNDGDALPCGLYAVTDSASVTAGHEVLINVLANDVLCDSINIKLEIYQPIGYAGQVRGDAAVMNDMTIRYRTTAGSSGVDYFFYKVTSVTDSSRYAVGRVSMRIEEPVENSDFTLLNDTYTFRQDSLASDTLRLYVFANDNLPGTGYTASVVSEPQHALDVTMHNLISLEYVLGNAQPIFTDSLSYQVCRNSQCKTARVYVKIE